SLFAFSPWRTGSVSTSHKVFEVVCVLAISLLLHGLRRLPNIFAVDINRFSIVKARQIHLRVSNAAIYGHYFFSDPESNGTLSVVTILFIRPARPIDRSFCHDPLP